MVQEVKLPILFKAQPSKPWTHKIIWITIALLGVVLVVSTVEHYQPFKGQKAIVLNGEISIRTPNPIIGIHAHATSHNDEYIAASYVKWIESAGGRAVRIPYNLTGNDLVNLLDSVNGVLFPGGDGDPNDTAEYIYNYAIELNNNGIYFPIWGTCLGFEWLVQIQSKNYSILDTVDAANISSTLTFQRNTNPSSRIFSFSPFFDILEKLPLTDNFHDFGIFDWHFAATDSLTSFYNPVATSLDRQGRRYVSVIEAFNYPFYGTQFHPEKNAFEFGEYPDGRLWKWIDHRYEAVLASQSFAHFFIQETRRNSHTFADPERKRVSLLYNAKTSNRSYPAYVEVLIFDPLTF